MNTYIGEVYDEDGRKKTIIIVNSANKKSGEKKIRSYLCAETDFFNSRDKLFVELLSEAYMIEMSAKIHGQTTQFFKGAISNFEIVVG